MLRGMGIGVYKLLIVNWLYKILGMLLVEISKILRRLQPIYLSLLVTPPMVLVQRF